MAAWPIPSLPDPRTQTFPVLSSALIDRIRPLSKVRDVSAGEVLFEPNDSNVPFFVLLSGNMEIVQPDLNGERRIATHAPGEFTGEMSMITGQRCLVTGRITEEGQVLEMSPSTFRNLIAKDAELSEIFMRAFILRRIELVRSESGLIVIMGSRHSGSTLVLREFLSRNGIPHRFIDLDTDKTSQELLDRFNVQMSEIPVVICRARTILRNPTPTKLAECLGLNLNIDTSQVRDVIIVGGGPSGLAAAVYAASEGLDAVVVEASLPGGQAGSSSKIENYLGFPTGISGQELTNRAVIQAEKFGAKLMLAHNVVGLDCDRRPYKVKLDNGVSLTTRSIVIASGAQYNKPKIENLKNFEGQGIYYGATFMEAQLCSDEEIVIIGGGNSAGQAAVFLTQSAKKVYMLVRSSQLSDTMSRYLIQRIEENPSIELHYKTEVVGLEGNAHLEKMTWRRHETGTTEARDIRHLFVMAGASPRTEWLQGCLALDNKGFILTGRDLESDGALNGWPLARSPYMLETSLPGVFAVGDVRAGNVKRVASAVGEGSISIHLVHRALAEQ
jgi:thioredoxin reductase (NADPH)